MALGRPTRSDKKRNQTGNIQCRHWTPFKIPEAVLSIPSQPQPQSALLNLPPDILSQIFVATDPVTRIAMAFACRSLLAVGNLRPRLLTVPDLFYHREIWAVNSADKIDGLCACDNANTLLWQIRPSNPRSGREASDKRHCRDCHRWFHKSSFRKTSWRRQGQKTLQSQDFQAWLQDAGDPQVTRGQNGLFSWPGFWREYATAARLFHRGYKRQCPECAMRVRAHIITLDLADVY